MKHSSFYVIYAVSAAMYRHVCGPFLCFSCAVPSGSRIYHLFIISLSNTNLKSHTKLFEEELILHCHKTHYHMYCKASPCGQKIFMQRSCFSPQLKVHVRVNEDVAAVTSRLPPWMQKHLNRLIWRSSRL